MNNIVGSWKANRDGRLNSNTYVLCSDILTLDADGRSLRQFDTTKVVVRADGAKEQYRVVVTLVGTYTLTGDVIKFVDLNPRFEFSEYTINTDACSPEVKEFLESPVAIEAGKAALEGAVAEVMMNKAQECQFGNSGKIPTCHVRADNNQFGMKWEGYDGEDVFEKCEEPANLSRTAPATPVEEALKSLDDRFMTAVRKGDCKYLNNAILYMPCGIETKDDQTSYKIEPLQVGEMNLIVAFTDKITMNSSDLKHAKMSSKLVKLNELNAYMGVFDGVCLNPVNGKSICLRAHMIDAMVNNKWGGIGIDGKFIIKD